MSQTILFPNADGLAWLLWGEPGTDPKKAPAYPVLIQAREAWTSGNPEMIQKALKMLSDFIVRIMFQPLPDAGGGSEKDLLVLGYQLPQEPGRKPSGLTCVAMTIPPVPTDQIVEYLRKQFDDRHHTPGFFDECIKKVLRVSPINLAAPKVPIAFGAAPAPELPAQDTGDVV